MKKYILKQTVKVFYDGHGCGDDGGVTYDVEHTDKYNDLDFSKVYNEDMEEEDEDAEYGAEDGYNCDMEYYAFNEITEEEYNNYKAIISDYNNLKKLF